MNYTVTVSVEGPNGCVNNSTDTFVIQVQPKPVAHISSPDSMILCAPADFASNPATLNLNISPGYPAPANIQWYFNGNPLSTPPPHNTATATQAGDYWAELTGANGCTTTTGVTLRIDNCSGNPGGCTPNGSINTLTAQMTACGEATATVSYSGSPISFDWAVGGPSGTISNKTAISADFSFTEAGLHSIFYYATFNGTDANGGPCTEELYRSFNIDVPYIAGLSYTVSCGTTPGTYDVTLYDDSSHLQPIQNFDFKVDGASVGTNGPVTVPLTPGPHTLELLISSSGFFPCTATLPINLPDLPSVQINAPTDACAGTPVQFTATVNDPNLLYDWNFTANALNSLPDPIRNFSNPGNKTVKLTVTNRFGCVATAFHPITINGTDMDGELSLSPQACYGDSIKITYSPTIPPSSISLYHWHLEVDGVIVNTTTTSVDHIFVTKPGVYILEGEDGSGCSKEEIARIKVVFLETPVAGIAGPHKVCDGPFQLHASPGYGDYQYTWKRDGQVLSTWNDEAVIEQDLPPGIYDFEVSIASPAGCSDTANFQVEVFPSPDPPSVSIQSISCDPYIYELTATHPDQGTFVWSDGQSGPVINVNHGGPYRVTFFDQNACPSSFEVDVPKNNEAYIWVAPEGCYETCEIFLSDYYLSGPVTPMDYWEWQIDGTQESSGTGMVADQYLAGNGLYQLSLGTAPCTVVSEGMEWSIAPGGCEGWCEITVRVGDIKPSMDMYGNCYYILHVVFTNNDPPFSYTLDNLTNGGVIVPGGGVLPNGNTPVQLEFYPPDGFSGGMVDFRVLLELLQGEMPNCMIEFSVNFPSCPPGSSRPANLVNDAVLSENSFTALPNPTNAMLNIGYDLQVFGEAEYSLHLYDLSGREIRNKLLGKSPGSFSMNLQNEANGLYLLVLRKNGQAFAYKKIVLSK